MENKEGPRRFPVYRVPLCTQNLPLRSNNIWLLGKKECFIHSASNQVATTTVAPFVSTDPFTIENKISSDKTKNRGLRHRGNH